MVVLIEELCKLWKQLYIGCAAQFLVLLNSPRENPVNAPVPISWIRHCDMKMEAGNLRKGLTQTKSRYKII